MSDLKQPDDGALISIPESAWELHCKVKTIYRMIRAKRLAAVRVSKTLLRVKRDDVAKLREEARAYPC